MPLTGLALCVMNGAVTDGDRFVFNTCGCTIRSASCDKLGGFFVPIISISFRLRLLTADVVTEGVCHGCCAQSPSSGSRAGGCHVD